MAIERPGYLGAIYLAQRIMYQYLMDNDLDSHLQKIKQAYKKQCDLMLALIEIGMQRLARSVKQYLSNKN